MKIFNSPAPCRVSVPFLKVRIHSIYCIFYCIFCRILCRIVIASSLASFFALPSYRHRILRCITVAFSLVSPSHLSSHPRRIILCILRRFLLICLGPVVAIVKQSKMLGNCSRLLFVPQGVGVKVEVADKVKMMILSLILKCLYLNLRRLPVDSLCVNINCLFVHNLTLKLHCLSVNYLNLSLRCPPAVDSLY